MHKHPCGHSCTCKVRAHSQCVDCEISEDPLDSERVMLYRWRLIMPTEIEVERLTKWLDGRAYV